MAASFIHQTALVETELIGEGTRIWAFAHVMGGAVIGTGCNIGDHCFIESGVVIGNDVTVKNGVSIWEGVTIEDRVFVGPNASFTNDLRPRSKVYHSEPIPTVLRTGASLGANCTIIAGSTIGSYALVGAGSVVASDVRDFELVFGNPARHKGWVSKSGNKLEFVDGVANDGPETYRLYESGVVLIHT